MSRVASSSAVGELRVIYLAGPGDAPAVLRNMAAGKPVDDAAHVAYSRQLFEACETLGAHVLSVSNHSRLDDFTFKNIRAVNRPNPVKGKSGLAFHLAQIPLAQELWRDVREFRANVIIMSPEPYPFLIEPLAFRGVKLIPALHAVLLPEFTRPSLTRRLMVQLSRRFYSHDAYAILSHPGGTVRQVHELTGGTTRPVVEFLPLYRGDEFSDVKAPEPQASTFRIMTVGRVEADKGIFALIEVAKRVKDAGRGSVRFDVCGAGSALEDARKRVVELGLSDMMTLHGWTEMADLKRLWGESHLAVIPTTSDFVEGFNQVVIEALLAGRPVVTSRVCPALEFVRPCAVEVEVDDIQGYVNAILELSGDRTKYLALQSRAEEVTQPFLDESKSFGAAVRHALTGVLENRQVTPVAHPPRY